MAEQSIRFGITDGSKRRASTWKCWTPKGAGKNDVYLACRSFRGTLKASLHESGNWHIGYSHAFFGKSIDTFAAGPKGRFIDKWARPPDIAPGVMLAFRIVTPSSAVNLSFDPSKYGHLKWIPNAPEGRATEIDILITSPAVHTSGWPGKRSMNTQLVDSMKLDSGERVWVVYHVIDMPNFAALRDTFSRGAFRYFKGRSRTDVTGPGLRAIAFAEQKDRSRIIYDCAVVTTE
jgi:hypothetical protein